MISIFLTLLLIPLGYLAGGGHGKHSGAYSPFIGVIYGYLLGVTGWPLILFAATGWLSEKPSPAADAIGAITDGTGRWSDYMMLAGRGLLGGLFYLPFYYFDVADTRTLLLLSIIWPVSALIGKYLPGLNAWTWCEILRYPALGAIVIITRP